MSALAWIGLKRNLRKPQGHLYQAWFLPNVSQCISVLSHRSVRHLVAV